MVIPTQRSGADEVAQNYLFYQYESLQECINVQFDGIFHLFTNATAIILDFLYNIQHSNEISPISKIELRDT